MLHELDQKKAPLILVAEDNKTTQRTITIFLKNQGYRVIEVDDGQQALNFVDRLHPDLLLMDIFMPVMDGCTACGEINKKYKENAPPIIMITALDEAEAVEKAFTAGAIDYITKPINWTVLKNRMLVVLQERQASKALEQLSHQYQLILNAAGDGILKLDAEGYVNFANPAAERMLGWIKEDLIGLPFHNTFHHSQTDDDSCKLEDCPIYDAATQGLEYYSDDEVFCRKDGSSFSVKLSSTPIYENEKLHGVVFVFDDITKQKEEEAILRHKATHDAITGLPNRDLFNDRLLQAVAWAHRYSQIFALLFIDLDDFKPINDKLGHTIGDQIIKELGQRLLNRLRASDTTYRYGDDEFVIILQNIKADDDASLVAEEVLDIIRKPVQINGEEYALSASIGISIYPSNSEDPDTLITQADQAMYQAKENGKNGYALYQVTDDDQPLE